MPAFRVLLLLPALLFAASAGAAKPPLCPSGAYVLVGQRLLPGDASSDMVLVQGKRIGIQSGCPFKRGTVSRTKQGTRIAAQWKHCGQARKVSLRALIDPTCRTMTGTLKGKG